MEELNFKYKELIGNYPHIKEVLSEPLNSLTELETLNYKVFESIFKGIDKRFELIKEAFLISFENSIDVKLFIKKEKKDIKKILNKGDVYSDIALNGLSSLIKIDNSKTPKIYSKIIKGQAINIITEALETNNLEQLNVIENTIALFLYKNYLDKIVFPFTEKSIITEAIKLPPVKTHEKLYESLIFSANESPTRQIEGAYELLKETWFFLNSDEATFNGKEVKKEKRPLLVNPFIEGRSNFDSFFESEITYNSKQDNINLIEQDFIIDLTQWIEIRSNDVKLSTTRKRKLNEFLEFLRNKDLRPQQIEQNNIDFNENKLKDKIKKHFNFFQGKCLRKEVEILESEQDYYNLIEWVTYYFENDFSIPEIETPIKRVNTNIYTTQLAFMFLFEELRLSDFHSQKKKANNLFELWQTIFLQHKGYKESNFWKVKHTKAKEVKKQMKID